MFHLLCRTVDAVCGCCFVSWDKMANSKVAIVTGGNKGIGLAIVRALCKQFDGDVFLTARNDERGKEAVKLIESEGLKVKYHQLVIDDKKSIQQIQTFMTETYNGIDVLVNNAAIALKMKDTTPFGEQAKVTLAANFFGTLDVLRMLLPTIKPNGRVVNVSSMAGASALGKCSAELQQVFRSDSITEKQLCERMEEFIKYAQKGTHTEHGYPNTAYGVSKIGVTVLTIIQARQLQKQEKNTILVNCCCRGWVCTDMAGAKAPKTPDQVAETPVFLAMLPPGTTEPNGKFLFDKTVRPW